jgi:hypothetical protein
MKETYMSRSIGVTTLFSYEGDVFRSIGVTTLFSYEGDVFK